MLLQGGSSVVLWLFARFSNLSLSHYLVIMVTIVAPVVLPIAMDYFAISGLWVRLVIQVSVNLLWFVLVVVVVSRLVERDAGGVRQSVTERVDPVAAGLESLREEYHGSIADVRLQLEDLERRTQSALQDLGVDLPPKTVNLRVSFSMGGSSTVSAHLRVSGGSRWTRIRRRFRRMGQMAWGVFWGGPQEI